MATRECARCRRLFEIMGLEDVCPVCAPLDQMEFQKIKDYLMEHQGASSSEVMQETGVSIRQIKRYLKEERLEIVGENKGFLKCELCAKPIRSGRFCDDCFVEGTTLRRKGLLDSPGTSSQGGYKDLPEREQKLQKGFRYGEKGK